VFNKRGRRSDRRHKGEEGERIGSDAGTRSTSSDVHSQYQLCE